MSSLDPNFVIWFSTAAGALGVVMVSGLLAAFVAFVIRIVKRESFESRTFIVRTAICWVVLVIASPFLGVGAILVWLNGLM
jgi:hypothetical protein